MPGGSGRYIPGGIPCPGIGGLIGIPGAPTPLPGPANPGCAYYIIGGAS